MINKKVFFSKKGFTLVELLVVLTIISIFSSAAIVSFKEVRSIARDSRRKDEVAQFGRILTEICHLPNTGGGEYDLVLIINELKAKYSLYNNLFLTIPKDPLLGTDSDSMYIYTVSDSGQKCALYANLESNHETITLLINSPQPGGGTGILEAGVSGWNNSPFYFQYSN